MEDRRRVPPREARAGARPHRSTLKAPRVIQFGLSHAFEAAFAAVFVLIGLSWAFFDGVGARSPLGREFAHWQYVWATLYIAGGGMILAGIAARQVNVRMSGLILVGTGALIQFIAALSAPLEPRTFTYLIWAAACGAKVVMLHQVYVRGKTVAI